MPFEKPSISELRERIIADIELYTGQSASQRGDMYFPIAMAHAGACYGLHGHLDYNRDQLFDDTADDEALLARAAEFGIYQIVAAHAEGTASIEGSNGYPIPAETLYQHGDIIVRVTTDAVVAAGEAVIHLRALAGGTAGNLQAGTVLTAMSTLPGINSQATVIEFSGGADIESVDRVRERLSNRRKNPPMGGNADDYVAWAKEAHVDVTRAWCYKNENGAGTVVVRFVTDNLATPIPTSTHITAVYNYIDAIRPAGMAGFDVGVIVAKPLNITFTSVSPDTVAVRGAIEAELDDMVRREATPGGTVLLSHIREAISIANDEHDYTITLNANITSAPNELIVLGTITWPV